MRRAIILIVLAGAGFAGYRYYSASYSPVKAYENFAEEMLHQRYDAAAKLCDGLTAAELEKLGSQERIGAGPPMFQTLFPSRFAVQSRETLPDGYLTINAVQTVLFNPVGVESAIRPAMYATLRQSVMLRKVAGAWKVTAFDSVFQKMDRTSAR